MLAEFLDLAAHDDFKCVSGWESSALRFWGEEKQGFRRDCLHFYANADGIDGEGRLIVDAETTGEGLAELDRAKGRGECEEVRGMGEVAEGLWVPRERRGALEREDGGRGMGREMGRGGEEGLPGGGDLGALAGDEQGALRRGRDIRKDG